MQLCPPQGDVVLQCDHVIEVVTKLSMMASKVNYVNICPGRWGLSNCFFLVFSANPAVLISLSCLRLSPYVWSAVLGFLWLEARRDSLISSGDQSSRWPKASEDICSWWVSGWSNVMCEACSEGGGFFVNEKHFDRLIVFNLISLCRPPLRSTQHEETGNSLQTYSNPFS